jgi:uncharacterized 2Fe-2S/4Fe-4S cluster protein (DUF4445 family)
MENKKIKIEIEKREEARKIIKEIENFGVTENQKFDILFGIASSLENVKALQEITKIIKKFKFNINIDQEESTIEKRNNKIIT